MPDDDEQGGQFVAIFKVDKKLMSSNIAFILVDEDRRVQAINSSCISMLFLDIGRVRKMNASNVQIDAFAPELASKRGGGGGDVNDRQPAFPITWNVEVDYER